MFQEDENNLAVFEFYKKLPQQERQDCEVFITPEKILDIRYSDLTAENDLNRKLEMFRNMSTEELGDNLKGRMEWSYYTLFSRIVAAIKEYYQLRPNIIEKYPEFLI